MISVYRKFFALMLSLTLGLLPFQGVFATDMTLHMHGNSSEMSAMAGMDHMQSPEMTTDCEQCEQDSCCVGSSCSVQHCASCTFAAVLQASVADARTVSADNEAFSLFYLPDSTLSSLFRPPRS